MATLHQINNLSKLDACLPFLAAGDRLLLLEAASYLVLDTQKLDRLPATLQLYLLDEDLKARGIQPPATPSFTRLTPEQWVDLTLEAERVCSW